MLAAAASWRAGPRLAGHRRAAASALGSPGQWGRHREAAGSLRPLLTKAYLQRQDRRDGKVKQHACVAARPVW